MRIVAAAVATLALVAGTARAAVTDSEARARVTCGEGSALSLRAREEDERIRVDVEVRSARRGALWQVVLLHERRLVARSSLRAPAGGGAVTLRRTLPDWYGSDVVVVRATRAGESCRARVVLG